MNLTEQLESECVITWMKGEEEVMVYFPKGKECDRVKWYAENYPDEVEIHETDSDGRIVASLPKSYIKIFRPKTR